MVLRRRPFTPVDDAIGGYWLWLGSEALADQCTPFNICQRPSSSQLPAHALPHLGLEQSNDESIRRTPLRTTTLGCA
jgi:hypothetical protein